MFPKLSCKIADRLEYYGIVQKSNKALYEYGLFFQAEDGIRDA